MSLAVRAMFLAVTGGKAVRAERASASSRSNETYVAGGSKGNGQGDSAVQRQLQGNRPNAFASHIRPALWSLKNIAGVAGWSVLGKLMGATTTQTSKIWVVHTIKPQRLLIHQR